MQTKATAPRHVGRQQRGVAFRVNVHANDRLAQYGVTRAELFEALGDPATNPPTVAPTGQFAPTCGSPVRIGLQHGRHGSADAKDVLVAVTASGRELVVVVAKQPRNGYRDVITVFDPRDERNARFWNDDLSGPTRAGVYEMPPTHWYRSPR